VEQAVRQPETTGEVDPACLVDNLIQVVEVRRWDGGFSGELALIGHQRSIASL